MNTVNHYVDVTVRVHFQEHTHLTDTQLSVSIIQAIAKSRIQYHLASLKNVRIVHSKVLDPNTEEVSHGT